MSRSYQQSAEAGQASDLGGDEGVD